MDSLFRSLFDALTDSMAVLDEKGEIIYSNKSWMDFGESNGLLSTCIGINYLDLCNSAEGDWSEEAQEAARGIALILADKSDEFTLEYPCHSPDKERWFLMRARKFVHDGKIHLLVLHENITARKHAELDSPFQKNLLESILENIPLLLIRYDIGRNIVSVNRQFMQCIGLPGREIGPPAIMELCYPNPADRERFWEYMLKADAEWHDQALSAKSGKKIDVLWSNVRLADGTYLGIGIDVTERRTLMDSLLRSEERNSLAQSVANFGTWDWNIEKNTLEWSDTIESMFGLQPGEFRGTYDAFLECVHPDDRQSVIDAVNASLEEDAPYEIAHRIVWPDGSNRWLLEKGTVFRNSEEKAYRMVGIVQDITDRKTVDENLHLLQRCIEQAFDCIVITDIQGRIKYANPAFELLTGYSGKEVINRNPRILKSGKHDKAFYRIMWDTILNGRTWNGTLINRKKDGTQYHEAMTIDPVKNSKGKLENFIAIKRDISERILLQDEIRRLQHEYEAFMRHELKNLLAPIKSYSELLLHYEQEGLSDKQKLFITRVKESADRTVNLIDNLRKLHDFESGTYNLETDNAEVLEMVNNAAYDLKPLAGEYAVDVQIRENPGGNCVVSIDRTFFPGVLHNLLKNAIEHVMYETDSSQKTVFVALAREFNTAVIRINNRGEPIPREKLELFFEKFNSDRKKKKGGTGLGTTYAYLVTKAHGGDIFVQSNERDGTTVTVILPCMQ